MDKIEFSKEFFNIKDTLECGQIFRYKNYGDGYLVQSADKCAYVYEMGDKTVIETENKEYFYNYFDLATDYENIYEKALSYDVDFLTTSAKLGKGVRILRQDSEEMLFSFIISQNNNIPRIKLIIERLCKALGEEKEFLGEKYYAFPTVDKLCKQDISFYKEIGLGYRDRYILDTAISVKNGFSMEKLKGLAEDETRKELLRLNGIGPKVADCVLLFGLYKTKSFPVDTWIEKIYKDNFDGTLTDRKKISSYFIEKFGEYSGYIQQYMFYYKRSLEKQK